MSTLRLFNRQKSKRINLRVFRQICRAALEQATHEIAVHLVGVEEITRLNTTFLHHEGATDVITFDYRDDTPAGCLSGEIFICVDQAITQARTFHTQWQAEVVRYFIHGALHLQGCDDQQPGPRKKMKRQEERVLKRLSRRFPWGTLGHSERARK